MRRPTPTGVRRPTPTGVRRPTPTGLGVAGFDVIVIGAGPAGLTAAYELAKAGRRVALFEAAPQVGGMARTFSLWGQKVDLGPHRFFSSDALVNSLWLEVVGRDYAMVDRLTRIYYGGRFFHYPLQPANAFANLGPAETLRCLASYVVQQTRRGVAPASSFEDWVVGRFGRRLFEVFFKTYSEKLWGISCQELDADFAAQRIKKLSLYEAVRNALRLGKGTTHKTLVDRFAYPLEGTGMVYERMAERVRELGGIVRLGTPVKRIVHDGLRRVQGIELGDGTVIRADQVVSTMPLTHMVRSLGDLPPQVKEACEQLTFRNTTLVYLHVDARDLFPDQWLYVHSSDLRMGRVTNFRNWVPQLYGEHRTSILALEYWSYDRDELWREQDAPLIATAEREMRATGLMRDARVLDGAVVRVPRCYPVYQRGYRERLATVVDHLRTFEGLMPIGRYGAFKYNNQDHSILMGILAARNVLGTGDHDLWSVNTDYDSYQEGTVITETGLQRAA